MTPGRRPEPVTLRPATADDGDLLLGWANEPSTRAASFRPERIGADAHRRWFLERLASPSARLLIGSAGTTPVGVLRLERDADGSVEIGISVADAVRGRGLGRELLSAGLASIRGDPAFAGRTLIARVRADNDVSIHLFLGAGFEAREQSLCHGIPCIVLEHSEP
ncbi:MAG TPA: GNAT family N-acetyltransferase [Candidatus Limnocylindrales bacterium]|nr:GNAT family N-acetyltransferase [Candidatus Limnocylindrales bacterium]